VRKWVEPRKIRVPEELKSAVGGHPLVAETLVRRGLTDIEAARSFLDPEWYEPAPASELPHLVGAVERLERAIERGEEICVWGDFDVDGQTATAVLYSTLQDLGASVRYHVPVRATESHGVNLPVLEQLIADGVQLVLTCDTGITAHEAVSYANKAGVDVVITDHHDLPDLLPDAYAVVNPKMVPDSHPLRELPGVGCAYKVAESLYERAGRPHDVEQHLDLVALGIVADVAVQRKDARYLLQRGLQALRQTERLGLQALMGLAKVNPEWLTEEHIGFYLAPRLNAVGRLADASVAVELLTTEDLSRSRVLAAELEGLNARRKLLSDQVFEAAVEQVERDPSLLERGALVLSHPSWPAGVIGIVASRLVERYGLPTVLLATPPGELARGSARSVAGCNITAAISAQADVLASYGGHPMAAGLSMDPDLVPDFARGLARTVSEMLEGVEDGKGLPVAGYVSLSEVSLDLVEQLERLAPFGPGNPAPTLATKDLTLAGRSAVGRKGEHLQMIVEDVHGVQARLIWWQGTTWSLPEGRFDLAYTVRASDYRGQRELQIEWVDARPLERAVVEPVPVRAAPQTIDCRSEADPGRWLEQLRAREDVVVWAEAAAKGEVEGADRIELGMSEALVIWTVPPGWRELQGALKAVTPRKVYLVGADPGMDDPEQFLRRLAGLVKRALTAREGRVNLARLAAATAQREAAVSLGLDWLVEQGHVSIVEGEDEEIVLAPGSGVPGGDVKGAAARLRSLLQETAAYRRHFSTAALDTLLAR
jgi:single-stranded-DNA-specific exonuclease